MGNATQEVAVNPFAALREFFDGFVRDLRTAELARKWQLPFEDVRHALDDPDHFDVESQCEVASTTGLPLVQVHDAITNDLAALRAFVRWEALKHSQPRALGPICTLRLAIEQATKEKR